MEAVIAAKLSAVPATGDSVNRGWAAMNGCPETNSAQFTPDSGVGLKLPKMFRWKFGLVLAGFVGMSAIHYTAGYASDVETALNELASDSVAQYPCVRLMTAANGDIGCSSA
jgi:hypothetical protein